MISDFEQLPIDPRDASGDDRWKVGPDGAGYYAVTPYVPGVLSREQAVAMAVQLANDRTARNDRPTCGVFHDADVEIWQLPHTGRAQIRLWTRQLEKRFRRPVRLVQVWTHLGTCEQARQR